MADSHVWTNAAEPWTDKKHVCFLNSIEASFVEAMLEKRRRIVPLNRHLPDSSDSTLDLITQRGKPASGHSGNLAVDFSGGRNILYGGPHGRPRGSASSEPYDSSQDQVVPQMHGGRRDDGDDKYYNNVPVGSTAPKGN